MDVLFTRKPARRRKAGLCLAALCPAALLFFVAGCAHKNATVPDDPVLPMPETFSIYEETAPTPDRWWMGFDSQELNDLVRRALEGSLTVKVALARLGQARAQVIQAGRDRLPDLELRAGMTEGRRDTAGGTVTDRSRSVSLASTWELDFWGRVRAGHRSALLQAQSAREDLYASALTISAEVTLKWLEIISVRRQLDLLKEQLETNRTVLDLMELRYLKGIANALDIYQQRQAVAEVEAGFPTLEGRLETLRHDLNVLCGVPPRSDLDIETSVFPQIVPQPPTGLPADLLSRRPDLRSAGLELRAAGEDIAVARADRLPSITLSATAGLSSDSFSDLLERWIATLAANLAWPLFKGGSMQAEVTRREQILQERLAQYEQAVLDAIREVEDALVLEIKESRHIEALEKQLAISRNGFREAVSRYRKGLSDYLPVLSALTSTQRLERSIVQAQLERFSQRVRLHRALGGGWMAEEFGTQMKN